MAAIDDRTICITGGAGFAGSSLAVALKAEQPGRRIVAVDSLKRRGSELILNRLREHGIEFRHGDLRCPEDLESLPEFGLLIDCAAEPSVHAGAGESPRYVIHTNLSGTVNALEAARLRGAAVVFLSTSRVYPVEALNALDYEEHPTRYAWTDAQNTPGCSRRGITEAFPLDGARSFYGATKLASELLLQEYVYGYGMRGMINRCGVLAGPWQMGKVDQGVVTLWVARHYFQRELRYIGFGGAGKQVRDVLHVDDLAGLLAAQLGRPELWDGRVYNIGGGRESSLSLLELTEKCRALTGHAPPIGQDPETAAVDLRIYVTDTAKAQRDFNWRPQRDADTLLSDIHAWIQDHEAILRPVFT